MSDTTSVDLSINFHRHFPSKLGNLSEKIKGIISFAIFFSFFEKWEENEKEASDKSEKNVGKFSFVFTIFHPHACPTKTATQTAPDLLIVRPTFLHHQSHPPFFPHPLDESVNFLCKVINNEKVSSSTREFITSAEDLQC